MDLVYREGGAWSISKKCGVWSTPISQKKKKKKIEPEASLELWVPGNWSTVASTVPLNFLSDGDSLNKLIWLVATLLDGSGWAKECSLAEVDSKIG